MKLTKTILTVLALGVCSLTFAQRDSGTTVRTGSPQRHIVAETGPYYDITSQFPKGEKAVQSGRDGVGGTGIDQPQYTTAIGSILNPGSTNSFGPPFVGSSESHPSNTKPVHPVTHDPIITGPGPVIPTGLSNR